MKFVLGLGTGIMLGLLFAPATGEETRRELAAKAEDFAQDSQRKILQKAGDMGSELGRKAAESAVAAMTEKLVPENARTAQK